MPATGLWGVRGSFFYSESCDRFRSDAGRRVVSWLLGESRGASLCSILLWGLAVLGRKILKWLVILLCECDRIWLIFL